MEEIFLDCNKMLSIREAHEYIREAFRFPEYYGGNLDALWDLLSSKRRLTSIFLLHEEKLYDNLGDYGRDLMEVFKDVAESNENIQTYMF